MTFAKLHPEIQALIFENYLFGDGALCEYDQTRLINLTLVSREWREQITNLPQLWSTIAFDLQGTKTEALDVLRRCKTWFFRARNLPLAIEISCCTGYTGGEEIWKYLATLEALKTLTLAATSFAPISGFFKQPHGFSSSLNLRIEGFREPRGFGPRKDCTQMVTGDAICLARSAVLGSVVSKTNNITSLSIKAAISAYFALSLIQESPLLEVCELDFEPVPSQYDPGEEPHSSMFTVGWGNTVLTLERLRRFRLGHLVDNHVLRYLRLPHLCELQLGGFDLCLGRIFLLRDCLGNSSSTLMKLVLRRMKVSDHLLQIFLGSLPAITTLNLDALDGVKGSFFERAGAEGATLLPNVSDIDMVGSWDGFDVTPLLRFIKCRRKTRGDGEGSACGRLQWVLFQDSVNPNLFVRFDASDPVAKLLRTVKVSRSL